MITAYRIFKAAHANGWNDGEGAFRFGGRWNTKGTRVLYAAASLALSALEMLVQLEDEEILAEYRYAAVTFPEDSVVNIEDLFRLPAGWNEYPASAAVQEIGDRWVRDGASLALRVPTAVVPHEFNCIFNLGHPDASAIEYGKVERFAFDPGFGRKRGKK